MKNIIRRIIALSSIILLCGCNLSNNDSNAPLTHKDMYKAVQTENGIQYDSSIRYGDEFENYYFYIGKYTNVPVFTSLGMVFDHEGSEKTFDQI